MGAAGRHRSARVSAATYFGCTCGETDSKDLLSYPKEVSALNGLHSKPKKVLPAATARSLQ